MQAFRYCQALNLDASFAPRKLAENNSVREVKIETLYDSDDELFFDRMNGSNEKRFIDNYQFVDYGIFARLIEYLNAKQHEKSLSLSVRNVHNYIFA